jgi:DnaJ family protein A protein 2
MTMPNENEKGDMYIVFQVEMPDDEWLKSLDKEVYTAACTLWLVKLRMEQALAKLLPPKKADVPASVITDATYVDSELQDVSYYLYSEVFTA